MTPLLSWIRTATLGTNSMPPIGSSGSGLQRATCAGFATARSPVAGQSLLVFSQLLIRS
jgi:hypothetical protein